MFCVVDLERQTTCVVATRNRDEAPQAPPVMPTNEEAADTHRQVGAVSRTRNSGTVI